MSKQCEKNVNLNIGIADCCGEKKEKKRKEKKKCCLVLPVCGSLIGDLLPEGGDPGDHLVKDGDNNPIWKPAKECDCDPDDQLPEGGEPGDVLARDEENKPIWKPVSECGCEPDELLPDGGEPGDVLARDEENKPIWKPISECGCEIGEFLPEGGAPNDVLGRDEENNPVWKPIAECGCEPDELLPDGGEPGNVLARDDKNRPVWKPIKECACELGEFVPEGGKPGDHIVKDENNVTIWMPEKVQPKAAQTFYVRKDGNDENSGLANNSGEAFLTINGALTKIQERQFTSPYQITIHVGEGNFVESVLCPVQALTSSQVRILGAGAGKTIVTAPSNASALSASSGRSLVCSGIAFQATVDNGLPIATVAAEGCTLIFTNDIRVGMTTTNTRSSYMLYAQSANIMVIGTATFSGNADTVWYATHGGSITIGNNVNTTAIRFVDLVAEYTCKSVYSGIVLRNELATISTTRATITRRFYVAMHGSITAGAAGLEWLPGNAAGSVDSNSFGYYG